MTTDTELRPYEKVNKDGAPFRPYPIECVMPRMVVLNEGGRQFDVVHVEESFDGGIWIEGLPAEEQTNDNVWACIIGFPPVDLWGIKREGTRVWVAVCADCYKPLVASDIEGPGSCYDPSCFLSVQG